MAVDEVEVGTGNAERVDSASLEACHHLLVHQPAIHHRYDVEHSVVGYSPTLYHGCFHPEACRHLGGGASAAVHKHFLPFDGCKIAEQGLQGSLILQDFASHFHYCYLFHYSENSIR